MIAVLVTLPLVAFVFVMGLFGAFMLAVEIAPFNLDSMRDMSRMALAAAVFVSLIVLDILACFIICVEVFA